MTEKEFEDKLIKALSTGETGYFRELGITKEKLWEFRDDIKTTDALWDNFAQILYKNNQEKLMQPLSPTEFAQVKKEIEGLTTPYKAGQFLYGMNGVSQVEVDLDDGRHVFLTVFDQSHVGAGSTVYQVVHQIERPAKVLGKRDRRFDVTLLINGLPIIQIELKTDDVDVNDALNQMHQYIEERQYSDIYSTVQILIAMTPYETKYMANTTPGHFNKDFAFNWKRKEDKKKVRDWKEFADLFLSIPAAHRMSTTYMILDGTRNRECLKVMRPYQVYATEAVLDKIKNIRIDNMGIEKLGFVWHTTGAGKTITSFKTAWLASRMSVVDKVVFIVDRTQLTRHTFETYRAYDPEFRLDDDIGKITDTRNTWELTSKLKSKKNDIIITSTQKLNKLTSRKGFKPPDKRILFIVDEAHRSTGTFNFEDVQKKFPHAAWVGYSGTPTFEDRKGHRSTRYTFGDLLHAYTIRDAIADRNVLGFKVDFRTTIPTDILFKKELPNFYRRKHPDWTDERIEEKIAYDPLDDLDDSISSGLTYFDENPNHIKAVVEDIYENWRNRSNDGKYNALLTTHVGGNNRPSTRMAMMYFDEFCRVNAEHEKEGGLVLKVAVTFSEDNGNDDYMVEKNSGLSRAIDVYNKMFGTEFGIATKDSYMEDLVSRLDKSADDGNYLDLVIVVDQLLTGFDAPQLNTLYVDRILKGSNLIQAYSRTNRVHNMQDKPWGQIVNYRLPELSEKYMNEALAQYSNEKNADAPVDGDIDKGDLDGVIAKQFNELLKETQDLAEQLRKLTYDFDRVPDNLAKQHQMLDSLRKYNSNLGKLKQYPYDEETGEGYNYDDPDALIEAIGLTDEESKVLSTTLTNELKRRIADSEHVAPEDVDLTVVHLKDIYVDFDYLTELIGRLMNEVHDDEMDKASKTKEEIFNFADGLNSQEFAHEVRQAAEAIFNRMYPTAESGLTYPYQGFLVQNVIKEAQTVGIGNKVLDFLHKWGLIGSVSQEDFEKMLSVHRLGQRDLDDAGEMSDMIFKGASHYEETAADPKVREMRKLKYRNELREAIYDFADHLIQE